MQEAPLFHSKEEETADMQPAPAPSCALMKHCISLHARQAACNIDNVLFPCREDDAAAAADDDDFAFENAFNPFYNIAGDKNAFSLPPLLCNDDVSDDDVCNSAAHADCHISQGVVINGDNLVHNINSYKIAAPYNKDCKASCGHCMQCVACNDRENALKDLISLCPIECNGQNDVFDIAFDLHEDDAPHAHAMLGSLPCPESEESALHGQSILSKECEEVAYSHLTADSPKCNEEAIYNAPRCERHKICDEDCEHSNELGNGVGKEKQLVHNSGLDFESDKVGDCKDGVFEGQNPGLHCKVREMGEAVAGIHEESRSDYVKEVVENVQNGNHAVSLQHERHDSEMPDCSEMLKKVLVCSIKNRGTHSRHANSIANPGLAAVPHKKNEPLSSQYSCKLASTQKLSSFSSVRQKNTDNSRLWRAYANASFSTCLKLPSSNSSLTKSLLCPAPKRAALSRSVSLTSEHLKASHKSSKKPLPATCPKNNSLHSLKACAPAPSIRGSPPTSKCKAPLKSAPLNTSSTPNAPIPQAQTSAAFARLMALPLVNAKAREEVRLDLRGQKVKSLDCNLVNLTAKLEFVYLRDNKLSHLAGIEILRRVKVLDLSFNEFKGLGLHPLASCKALQQLYLAGNQLTSLSSLPQLPNLEFLSVAQNKLKDLTMASQPKLQVLAASKNKISTFKGFPHFPSLEHLRLEENPISDVEHVKAVAILLAGPNLKKFNNSDLTLEEQELACMYPPHTGLCIRDGWEFCSIENAFASSMKFLAEQWEDRIPSGYTFEKAFIEQPFEEYPCSSQFTFRNQSDEIDHLDLNFEYQWFIGGKTPSNFVPIEGANKEVYWPKHWDIGHCLKVECALVLGNMSYAPTFAVSFPVLPGTGCPKVIKLSVNGDFKEGNLIWGQVEVAWCGGSATKGIVSWLRHDECSSPRMVPGAEDLEYLLSLDDVGTKLILMYTPLTKEGIKGDPCFATTEVIKPGLPSVTDLRVIGEMVEGNTIRGTGRYFGGREGLSKLEWHQEVEDSGGFQLLLEGHAEFTLSTKDIGLRLLFQYTPVNSEGIEGIPVSLVTEKVSHAPPRVTSLRIIGDLCEGSAVSVEATISGSGIEGTSRVRWFKTMVPDQCLCATDLEVIGTSTVSETFHIPLGYFGFYLVVEYTPILADGVAGEQVLTVSSVPVNMLLPRLTSLCITGEHKEGETLSASYSYVGGNEGSSRFNWFLHENENDPGVLIPEAAGLLEYTISKAAINKFVSFKCVPVREDGYIGEERSIMGQGIVQPGVPKLLSLDIVGDPEEGSHLHIAKSYCGGVEGTSKIQWFQMDPTGCLQPIEGATSHTYTSTLEDIESYLCVSYEPRRSDGLAGSAVVSHPFGPVSPAMPTCEALELSGETTEGECLTFSAIYRGGVKGSCINQWFRQRTDGPDKKLGVRETLKLTLEDVGCCIKLVFTPVRKDGVSGVPITAVSGIVKAGEPTTTRLTVPNGCEDVEMIPQKCYFGGIEGDSEFTWFRLEERLEGFVDFNKAQTVGKSEKYTPRLEDVGSYLALLWIPVRNDGKQGKPCLACSSQKVAPASPTVHSVWVKRLSHDTFVGEGIYYGGFEGESQRRWYRQATDGIMVPIVGAASNIYTVTDEDYTFSLIFGFTPVRHDGVAGKLVLSAPTEKILPEVPRVQELFVKGKAIEGDVLIVTEEVPNEERQQHIWKKYIKEVKYHWARSTVPDHADSFEVLPFQRSCSYTIRTEDIGYFLQCECVVIDIFGRSSPPVSIISSAVSPGIPRIDKLEIEGRGHHSDMYAIRGIYSGGKEGRSVIQWFRAMARSPELFPIAREVGRLYEANVEDVGYRLVAVYTPVREDGVEGTPMSASTEPITVEPALAKEVAEKLGQGSFKFEALLNRDQCFPTKWNQGSGQFEKRVIDVNKRRIKVIKPSSKAFLSTELRYNAPLHVEVDKINQHRLKIMMNEESNVELMVHTRNLRDLIVLVIRGLQSSAS